jgi:hypothetical protein
MPYNGDVPQRPVRAIQGQDSTTKITELQPAVFYTQDAKTS